MKKKYMKKKGYKKYIILGFTLMYLVSMLLATYLMKEKYIETYQREAGDIIKSMISQIEIYDIPEHGQMLTDSDTALLQFILSDKVSYSSQYSMLSAGILNDTGDLLAKSADSFFIYSTDFSSTEKRIGHNYITYSFHEFFSKEEQKLIRDCYVKEQEHIKNTNSSNRKQDTPVSISDYNEYYKNPYKCLANFDDTGNMMSFEIRDVKSNQFSEELLYSWKNPDNRTGELYYNQQSFGPMNQFFALPYCNYGDNIKTQWKEDLYLHTFEKMAEHETAYTDWYFPEETGNHTYKYLNILTFDNYQSKEDRYILQVNQRINPWHAAIDYLKYIYLFSGIFVLCCTFIVLSFIGRYYKKQALLEQSRIDFTNAAAHELKTPLSIVRGLAEVMDESKSEEKKSVYRAEIVKQTEVMDELVKEMLLISKIDSEEYKMKQKEISITEVVKEQLSKLTPLIQSKNIHTETCFLDDFIIQGEKIYIEKAIFNLIENAVTHNKMDGNLNIRMNKTELVIENTGDSIPTKDLPFVCDMFFTGNKSRAKDTGHKGLGLYLAKKILDLYRINLIIENSDTGVRVTIRK